MTSKENIPTLKAKLNLRESVSKPIQRKLSKDIPLPDEEGNRMFIICLHSGTLWRLLFTRLDIIIKYYY